MRPKGLTADALKLIEQNKPLTWGWFDDETTRTPAHLALAIIVFTSGVILATIGAWIDITAAVTGGIAIMAATILVSFLTFMRWWDEEDSFWEYYRRNIRGYWFWYWIDRTGGGISYEILPNGEAPFSRLVGNYVIAGIPLGGWHTRGDVVMVTPKGNTILGTCTLDRIVSNLMYVGFVDTRGGAIPSVEIRSLLSKILNVADENSKRPMSSMLFGHLVSKLEDERAQLTKAWKALEAAEQHAREAAQTVTEQRREIGRLKNELATANERARKAEDNATKHMSICAELRKKHGIKLDATKERLIQVLGRIADDAHRKSRLLRTKGGRDHYLHLVKTILDELPPDHPDRDHWFGEKKLVEGKIKTAREKSARDKAANKKRKSKKGTTK